jgi:CubicO group peptidase (beta-lactamase class C family)
LTKWIGGVPASWRAVTIQHLLSHTSGIPDIFKTAGGDRFGNDLPSLLKVYQGAALQFSPGEKFQYSNANYIFLSYIIEKAGGKSYEQFLSENIFQPLQMKNTGFSYSYKGTDLAKPYANVFKMDKVPQSELPNLQVLKGAGAMYSTAADLSIFLQGMHKLLSSESLRMMLQPVKEDYGLGFHIQEQFGKITIKHPGGINGYASEMRYVPADSSSVVILSNVQFNDLNIRYTAFDILKLLNNRELDIDTAINEKLTGKYSLPKPIAERAKSDFLEIKSKDGKMILSLPGMPETYLVPFAKGKYFFYGEASNAEFSADGKELKILSPSLGEIMCKKK